MKSFLIALAASLIIFSFFAAIAYIALDAYTPGNSGNLMGQVIVGGIKWVSATIGDKVSAAIILLAGLMAVGKFLLILRKEAQDEAQK